ncbi:MAG: endonuclease MutS2 [Spirochaetes bacterium]|nr:endonuclease MutS2 [Spirochaetota bacterium]
MENTYFKHLSNKLEFELILNKISQYANSIKTKENIASIQPDSNIDKIRHYHHLNSLLNKFIAEKQAIPLENFFNFTNTLHSILKNKIVGSEILYRFAHAVSIYFRIRKAILQSEEEDLLKLFTIDKITSPFYAEILKHFRPDGYIENSASVQLKNIRNKIGELTSRIKKETDQFFQKAKQAGITADDIVSVRNDFLCIAIKVNYKNRLNGVVIDSSQTGQTVFMIPQSVLKIKNDLAIERDKEQEEIQKIIVQYCEMIKENNQHLFIIDTELIYFDQLHAICCYSHHHDYQSPKIINQHFLEIIEGKHPQIEKNVVPLNVKIGEDKRILIITGPNTGGKTVVLKTVGLFSLMVQSGIPIPASSSSTFCIFDHIFIDVGDEQSIEQSLSTFSAHIKHLKQIIEGATENSLVLLDELGSGTDPVEGSALAIGIINFLKSKKLISIITTHSTVLKNFAAEETGIANASMEFNQEELAPTYKLLMGIPGSSKALEISQRLGLPNFILENARQNLDQGYVNTEKLLQHLEEEKKNYDQKIYDIAKLEEQLKQKEKQLAEQLIEIHNKEKQLKKLINQQEYDFLKEKRKEFETIIKEIRTREASKETIKQGKEFFTELEHKISEDQNQNNQNEQLENIKKLEPGDEVLMISKQLKGTVLEKANKNNEYLIQFGIMKLNCRINDLKKIKSPQKSAPIPISHKIELSSKKSMQLDLRGVRFDDAQLKLDQFIQQAIINHISQVKIIHGMGTGAIRKLVQDFIKSSPFITDAQYEKIGEYQTNYGVTILSLKN